MAQALGDRQAYGWLNHRASWHLNLLHGSFSKACWLCSDVAGTNKSSGRKRVKWAESMFGRDPDWSGSQEQRSSDRGNPRQATSQLEPDTQLGDLFVRSRVSQIVGRGDAWGVRWTFPIRGGRVGATTVVLEKIDGIPTGDSLTSSPHWSF